MDRKRGRLPCHVAAPIDGARQRPGGRMRRAARLIGTIATAGAATLGTASLLAPAAQAAPVAQAASAARAARSPVVIREIYYNSPGPDYGSNSSLNHEWVKLHNRTNHAVTMTHW